MDWDELDEEEEYVAVLATMIVKNNGNRKTWVHPINLNRKLYGEFHHLMPKLLEDEQRFQMYFRMNKDEFYYLLEMIGPEIEKRTTQLRESISPEQRLALCLR